MTGERLQKYLARCGIASRRQGESLILQGKVKVNGQIVTTLGTKIDPDTDHVEVGNLRALPQDKKWYLMLNKPPKVMSTCMDPEGRKTVLDLLPMKERLYPVGRLDYMTEGLLLLTNDGEWAHRLMHPRFHLPKTYRVGVDGTLTAEKKRQLEEGVILEDGTTLPAKVELEPEGDDHPRFLLTIVEGRNRQVRRMCQAVGLNVIFLQRIRIGTLQLGSLPLGAYRELNKEELLRLEENGKETGGYLH